MISECYNILSGICFPSLFSLTKIKNHIDNRNSNSISNHLWIKVWIRAVVVSFALGLFIQPQELQYPVYTVQPLVQPVVQPVWQPVVSCKRGLTQTALFTDETSKLTAVDAVFGGHSLSVFYCHDCYMVATLSVCHSYNLYYSTEMKTFRTGHKLT